LERVWLDGTQVRDLAPLVGLKKLREVHILGTPVNAEQVASLEAALPNCRVVSDLIMAPAEAAESP
jgi:hypothetical protein